MFGALKELIKRAESIDEDQLLQDALSTDSIKAQMIDLNQKQLYEEGKQADGSPTGEYAPITVSYYKPLAAAEGRDGRNDHITGKDTGITYESMKVVNDKQGSKIEADDRNNFFDREPKGLGLTTESLNEIIPEVRQTIIQELRQKLFK